MQKQTDGQGNTIYKYDKCPACKSKKRHYEDISGKAVEMGLAPDGYLVAYLYDNRPIGDETKLKVAKMGEQAPFITSATEICKDCGNVYAPMVITGKMTKHIVTQGELEGKPALWKPGDPA